MIAALTVLFALLAPAAVPDHWAFRPPVRPEVPAIREDARARNPIDRFVLAKLDAEGIEPAPEADRPTLLRRLSFDLTGLPPSPEEADAFLADDRPDAYERLVDRLLASPHFGERQAQAWLDLARYADSDGFEFDQARPEMWRYRDWVVSAFNRDLPFDRFVRLQLAGDEAAPGDPEALVATGFNRLYPDMVDLNDQGLRRQNALNDITETTASAFLGLTLGCARCHDHKYDPLKQREFYSLQAFFTPARFRDDLIIAGPEARRAYEEALRAWEGRVREVRAALLAIEASARETLAPGRPPGVSDDAARALDKPLDARSNEEVRLAFEALDADKRVKSDAIAAELPEADRAERDRLRSELAALKTTEPPPLPRARGLDEPEGPAPPTFLLRRGDFASKGPEVAPAFPAVLAADPSPTIAPSGASSGRRSALADWLVDPRNPLTARVMVNRLWQGHFGRGLVATPSDFGVMGEEPSHPELLDWLAREFADTGWGLKAMHRRIVTSATYRRSSRPDPSALAADPANSLLWRHSRQRLDGEAIRDAMLAASGLLNPALGGPCVFPELPAELTKLSNKGAAWPVSPRAEDRNRRSLYVFLRRNLRYPLFEAFDKPDTNASCPRRATTTIAPQALSLLNGKLSAECASALADRAAREATDEAGRIDRLYRLALGRSPDAEERKLASEFLAAATWSDLALALFNLNEFVYIE